MRGGVLAIHLEPGGERIERLDVDLAWVAEHLVVFDTGISHHSGMVNWQVIRRRLEGHPKTCTALEGISRAANECRRCLVAGDADGVGAAIADEWEHRKRLAPEICPPDLAEIENAAKAAGASAFKACGAGGGGSVLLWHGSAGRPGLIESLGAAAPNGRVVATEVARAGCRVVTPQER
jgi:D-glycero-alpha-D-manno-heptose-7-phosphate kinase